MGDYIVAVVYQLDFGFIIDLNRKKRRLPCYFMLSQVYLFHAFPVIEPDSVNVIFDIDLSYRTWEEIDLVCRDDDHRACNVMMVMVIWLGLLMPTMNLNIQQFMVCLSWTELSVYGFCMVCMCVYVFVCFGFKFLVLKTRVGWLKSSRGIWFSIIQ